MEGGKLIIIFYPNKREGDKVREWARKVGATKLVKRGYIYILHTSPHDRSWEELLNIYKELGKFKVRIFKVDYELTDEDVGGEENERNTVLP